ncbi:diguanylate cyclase (GGDEF)-like protein [Pararhizobium capsulatum DSM 1112]|uniref:diguanylate cyclase n=1 Tax=Pararhizobium capsulatum DSM 1112 TaxID=1121113 RepID=A0ABU0BR42_9HYPH|nr:diguanylate cyclase [Pararhizobium capsulatum]MDQ0320710.1 diguanylate cyclase (GGDEF)-like protein [Pararhizobium capsulatum DSM 1112]
MQKHANKRMLLIEDSRMFSTVLKHGLETIHGLSVTHCATFAAAQDAVKGNPGEFALAVLDLNLPDGPNCEALDYVIANGIAAVVFTGSFNDETRGHVLARGVVDCVIKNQPDSISHVISVVDRVLTNASTHVLLVDSKKESRAELLTLLRQQQFQVSQAVDGAGALAALDGSEMIELVVTDLSLSDMSAHVLLAEIRQRHGDDGVGVIALAASEDRRQAARFLQNGGTEFIPKPFLVDEFNSRIFHVANIRRRIQMLHNIAARDYLTDIYNRRYFFQHGPRLVDQCLRRGQTTSIAILDIDHFKRLNDTYGHEVGDLVLKAVAGRLRTLVGENHLLARLGGEEFGVLFNSLPVGEANSFCEMLREELAKTKVVADDEELSVTVSIGLATIETLESFDNYLNAADQFLYMAKYNGRNRIVSELTLLQSMTA